MTVDPSDAVPENSSEAATGGPPFIAVPPREFGDFADAGVKKDSDDAGPAVADHEPNGWFVGPADEPDRYELLGEGRSGGEGTLWRARYRGGLQSPLTLAVKVLHRLPGTPTTWPDDKEQQRLRDQGALLRHIKTDHLVRVFEVFTGGPPHASGKTPRDEATVSIAMEWLDGDTMAHALAHRPVTTVADLRARLEWVAQVARALATLHSQTQTSGNPSLHRDVKPANCILVPGRGAVLVDLSTLRSLSNGYDPAGLHTPAYTAPEVVADPRAPRGPLADNYSLGALALFAVLGEDPPTAAVRAGAADSVAPQVHTLLDGLLPATSRDLTEALLAMVSSDPSQRPTDGAAWAQGLLRLAQPQVTKAVPEQESGAGVRRSRFRGLLAAVASLVLLASVGLYVATRPQQTVVAGFPTITSSSSPITSAPSNVSATDPTAVPAEATSALGGSTAVAVVRVASGKIATPTPKAKVKQCAYFSGEATLPPNTTLILAMRNLDNGDPRRYVQEVFGWRDPSKLSAWRGAQFFGSNDDSAGQNYSVELIAVDLEATKTADNTDDALTALAGTGKILDTVEVHRVAGQGVPNNCPGP